MAIAPLFQQQLQAARQEGREEGREEGIEQGIEQGRQEQQRLICENFLSVRFGELDEKIQAFIPIVSTLPAAEFTVMLLSISMLSVDAEGRQQVHKLLAENLLRRWRDELGDRLPVIVTKLLKLPAEQLRMLLERWLELSKDELINLLGDDSGETPLSS